MNHVDACSDLHTVIGKYLLHIFFVKLKYAVLYQISMKNRRVVFSWALYDFANTAFSALFVTFFFPFYIKVFLGGDEFQIGLVMGVSMFLVGLLVPILGTWSDITGKRVKIIFVFTLLCVFATAATGFLSLELALLAGMIANFSYHACLVVYNAVLPHIVSQKRIGKVSGFGVALGYLGTLVSLVMVFFILITYGWETKTGISLIFPATALFFFVFALPFFYYVKDEKVVHKPFWKGLRYTLDELRVTIQRLTKFKGVIPFLLSSFSYSNGITAAIIFLYLYARQESGLSVSSFMILYAIFSVAAAAGAFGAGRLVDRIGSRKVLMMAGVAWIIVVGLLFELTSYWTFLIAGILGGAAMGSVWTANRPMIVSLVPKKKIGEFFGFDELGDKFSGVIGPILFGWLVVWSGYKAALFSLVVIFVIGFLLLFLVPERKVL